MRSWEGAGVAWLLLAGCSEQGFEGLGTQSIAVISGDFDDVTEPLDRLAVPYDLWDGVVGATPAWDPDYNPEGHARRAEKLLTDEDILATYSNLIVASGARGFGDVVYNGVKRDDKFAGDPQVLSNLADYAARSRTIFATDWAYDLIEATWPGRIDFIGDDAVLDAAQTGLVEVVDARITDDRLADALETRDVRIDFNFSNWAPVLAVGPAVTVWMEGTVHYRRPGDETVYELEDAPLLLSFEPEVGSGRIVYAAFHVDAQHAQVADEIYRIVVGPLEGGTGDEG